jgi:glycosyltransferase involved in cell wall biosynthesis
MYAEKSVAVVVPCYNEATQIADVMSSIPAFIDRIVVVDDASTDDSGRIVEEFARRDGRVILLAKPNNEGPGAAVATGFRHCLQLGLDVVAVMDGDGQMDGTELEYLIDPVATGQADYAKGNRLFHPEAWKTMPRCRYLGNALLSMLTKIASGYWHVADSQTGFIAISADALRLLDLEGLYPRYGYPNDLLVRMNVFDLRVAQVPTRPTARPGGRSKMSLFRLIPALSWLIFRRFCWRLWQKYVVHDFHPLVLFYAVSGLLGLTSLVLFLRMIWMWASHGRIPPINTMAWVFCAISATQLGLFAMWFDMETNRDLKVRVPRLRDMQPPGSGKDT